MNSNLPEQAVKNRIKKKVLQKVTANLAKQKIETLNQPKNDNLWLTLLKWQISHLPKVCPGIWWRKNFRQQLVDTKQNSFFYSLGGGIFGQRIFA